jgi:hypothetical protein
MIQNDSIGLYKLKTIRKGGPYCLLVGRGVYLSIIFIYSMMKNYALTLLISIVLLLTALASAQQCPKGYVKIKSDCIECKTLKNVRIDDVESSTEEGSCPCKPGYVWSYPLLRCWAYSDSSRNSLLSSG